MAELRESKAKESDSIYLNEDSDFTVNHAINDLARRLTSDREQHRHPTTAGEASTDDQLFSSSLRQQTARGGAHQLRRYPAAAARHPSGWDRLARGGGSLADPGPHCAPGRPCLR